MQNLCKFKIYTFSRVICIAGRACIWPFDTQPGGLGTLRATQQCHHHHHHHLSLHCRHHIQHHVHYQYHETFDLQIFDKNLLVGCQERGGRSNRLRHPRHFRIKTQN